MSYVPRRYEEIVRDLLTTLTGGTVREELTVPPGDLPIVLDKLRDRPVRRVSHLQGVTRVGVGEDEREIPYRFTAADFELISNAGDEQNKDAIRFREDGRRPVPGSTLLVNYYPVQTDPVPLTDLNVGSVVRTLMETFARELTLSSLQLEHIYESAFLETAEGSSLDKVIALVGVRRLPAGHPVVKVRFARQPGTPGRITVPAGTRLTDGEGNRYLTLSSITLEPNEASREVQAAGESPGTQPVEEGKLDRLEVLIAGISAVTNPQPSRRLSAPETDEDLRRRARDAMHGVVRGTLDALRFGIVSIPGVQDVGIIEAPNGVPGEVKIEVAYSDDTSGVPGHVARRIEELRPAGVRVLLGKAVPRRLAVRVELTLAGSSLADSEVLSINEAVEETLVDHLSHISPGGKVRRAKLLALVLEDSRVVDANVALLPDGGAEAEELELEAGEVLEVVRPFSFPPPTYEEEPGAVPAVTATVSAILPLHLRAGVTQANAGEAIHLSLESHLRSRGPEAPLSVDGLVAAIRDEDRFALVRSEVLLTVESGDRFLQLTDGVGSYTPSQNETLQAGPIDIEVREGMV